MRTVSNLFRVAFLVVAMTTPAVAQVGPGDEAIVQGSSILFRKPLSETREILITRGSDREARVLVDLLGEDSVKRIRAVYELRVQLASKDEPPITLASLLIPIDEHPGRLPGPASSDAETLPKRPHELAVLDIAFRPRVVEARSVSLDEIVIALRLNGDLYILRTRSLVGGLEIAYPIGWQGISRPLFAPVKDDPKSASLSHVDGLWVVDVLSGPQRTRLVETKAGRFEFEVAKRGGD